jgi:hypothetical protein
MNDVSNAIILNKIRESISSSFFYESTLARADSTAGVEIYGILARSLAFND